MRWHRGARWSLTGSSDQKLWHMRCQSAWGGVTPLHCRTDCWRRRGKKKNNHPYWSTVTWLISLGGGWEAVLGRSFDPIIFLKSTRVRLTLFHLTLSPCHSSIFYSVTFRVPLIPDEARRAGWTAGRLHRTQQRTTCFINSPICQHNLRLTVKTLTLRSIKLNTPTGAQSHLCSLMQPNSGSLQQQLTVSIFLIRKDIFVIN